MINIAKTAMALGKTVYTTRTAGARTTTMFDAFCKTMSRPDVAAQRASRIVADTEKRSAELKEIANKILSNSGVDAKISARVKGIDSTASKIKKKFTGFQEKGYESVKEQIYNVILGKGTGELVGDSYGFRYILNKEKTGTQDSAVKLYESILNYQKKNHKTFDLTSFEDYYGKGIKPYGNTEIRDKFALLKYKTSLGKTKETIAAFTEKPAGYTRTNINGRINGVNVEIQVGGKHTTKWGDVEHILYDMRQGKPLDMSKYTPEQIELAKKIQKAYSEVLSRKNVNTADEFSKKYLNKLWDSFRNAEVKNLDNPVYPEFPQGYPEILRVENLLKLAHD